jgi:DNA-binding NarL/FixJ family response regulator
VDKIFYAAMPTSVVIAENHDVTRRGMRAIVEQRDGTVVATAETGLDTLSVIEEHKPDVLILSLDLPHVSGFDVLRHLQRRTLAVEVMVLTTHAEAHDVRTAFGRGATAYALKQDSVSEVGAAFEATVDGTRYLSPSLSDEVRDTTPQVSEPRTRYRDLSERQREVLRLTAEGYTGEEVGKELDLSPRTIESHRRRIRKELGLRNVVEMTRYAVHVGLYSTPQSDWLDRTVAT